MILFTFAFVNFVIHITTGTIISFADSGRLLRYESITNKTHNMTTEMCCNNVIHERTSPHQDCCHSSIFDMDTEACCNGEKYNMSTHTCCKNMDRGYFYSEKYMSEVRVVDGINAKFCCGVKVIENEYKQLCCGGIIYENSEMKLDCCGLNKTYDLTKQICCPEKLEIIDKKNPDDNDCCNGKSFNSMTEVCCEKTGIVIAKRNVNDIGCCNGVSYNFYNHQCCQDTLIDLNDNTRCCNGKPYNTDLETCCDGEIMKTRSADDRCCNRNLYNLHAEGCCNGTIYSKESGICCFFEWHEMYHVEKNASVSQCCGFDLLRKADAGTPKEYCCKYGYQSNMYYNNDKTGKKIECCGFKPYDPFNEICCGDVVIPKSEDGKSSCCSFTTVMTEMFY